jgi:hypothetical protein
MNVNPRNGCRQVSTLTVTVVIDIIVGLRIV